MVTSSEEDWSTGVLPFNTGNSITAVKRSLHGIALPFILFRLSSLVMANLLGSPCQAYIHTHTPIHTPERNTNNSLSLPHPIYLAVVLSLGWSRDPGLDFTLVPPLPIKKGHLRFGGYTRAPAILTWPPKIAWEQGMLLRFVDVEGQWTLTCYLKHYDVHLWNACHRFAITGLDWRY